MKKIAGSYKIYFQQLHYSWHIFDKRINLFNKLEYRKFCKFL